MIDFILQDTLKGDDGPQNAAATTSKRGSKSSKRGSSSSYSQGVKENARDFFQLFHESDRDLRIDLKNLVELDLNNDGVLTAEELAVALAKKKEQDPEGFRQSVQAMGAARS